MEARGGRSAWIALNLLPGLTPRQVEVLLAGFGGPEAILEATEADLKARGRLSAKSASRVRGFQREKALEEELREAERLKVTIMTREEPEYPASLLAIPDPPPVLYVRGELLERDRLAIAIVGTRRSTTYGRRTAERLGRGLAEKGLTVVSGMARGVDSAAHRGALSGKGRTVAVFGSGLAKLYPPEAKELFDAIAQSGAVVSEWPLATPPLPRHFPQRNRVISGLALGTVVVKAPKASGALITARLAAEQGRDVFAVPGRVDSPQSRGTHHLLREGAQLVDSAEDILAELPPELVALLPSVQEVPGSAPPLPAREAKVFTLVGTGEKHIDRLIEESALSAGEVSGALMSLELKGLVRQFPGKIFARA